MKKLSLLVNRYFPTAKLPVECIFNEKGMLRLFFFKPEFTIYDLTLDFPMTVSFYVNEGSMGCGVR
jgi:hypothetical protein